MSTNFAELDRPGFRAYTGGRRARGTCETVVWWIRRDGEIMLAPHTDLEPLPLYQRFETNTVRDIEQMSRKMAAQEEAKIRSMRISEQIRSKPKWEQIATNCRLRLAAGCISKKDEAFTRHTLASVERKLSKLIEVMAGGGSFGEGSLAIEKSSSAIGMAQFGKKKTELA